MATDYITPLEEVKPLIKEFKLQLDPCTFANNPLGFKYFYTKEQDALKLDWPYNAYVNPPFENLYAWVERARDMARLHGTTNVMMLPCGTDTQWFHSFVYDKNRATWRDGVKVRFKQGRIKFFLPSGKQAESPRSPNMIVIFNGKELQHYSASS